MRFSSYARRRSVWVVAAIALAATACDNDDRVLSPRLQTPSAALSLQVSSTNAAVGSRIAVSVANESAQELAGLQGFLNYDATSLRYVGQVRDAGDDQVLLVNPNRAAQGQLRFAVLDPTGIARTGALVFEVIGHDYTTGLGFVVEEASTLGSRTQIAQADVQPGLKVNGVLNATSEAKQMSTNDWLTALEDETAAFTPRFNPGEVPATGLRYGDTNLSGGGLTVADGVYIINVSVGLNEMIIGSDGTGPTGDRDAVVAGNVFPFNDPGLGEIGDANPPGLDPAGTRSLTVTDGSAIVQEAVGIDQPVVGEIIPGRPLAPVTDRIVVSGDITTNTTWTNDHIYELQGGINVTSGATLTIQAGTRVEGQTGTGPGVGGAALFIQRDGRIVADGTPLQPITFTCVPTTKFKGCWGGLVVNGSSGLNDGAETSPVIPGRSETGGCHQKAGEGSSGMYGGCNDADSSGVIRYAVIEYAGFRFTPENELNGLALQGVGNKTVVDFVQIHAGLDDGIEMFGGTVNLKHLVLTANSDDSFDYTEGYRGKAQFIIVQHDSLDSDKGFENDNWASGVDNEPRATPTIYNVTMVGKADPASTSGVANNNSIAAFNVRVGARPHYFNFLVQNFRAAMDIDDASTCVNAQTATGFEFKNSIFTQNLNTADPDGSDPCDEAAFLTGQATNQFPASSPLLSPLDVMVPDFRPAFGTATGGATPPSDGFFDPSATYIGAVPPATAAKSNIPWYSGWTRGWQSSTTP